MFYDSVRLKRPHGYSIRVPLSEYGVAAKAILKCYATASTEREPITGSGSGASERGPGAERLVRGETP